MHCKSLLAAAQRCASQVAFDSVHDIERSRDVKARRLGFLGSRVGHWEHGLARRVARDADLFIGHREARVSEGRTEACRGDGS